MRESAGEYNEKEGKTREKANCSGFGCIDDDGMLCMHFDHTGHRNGGHYRHYRCNDC
jgi:hypothetical protein